MGYPDKSAIYPEVAPPAMLRQIARGNYDRFRQFLASRSELTFVDAEEIMKRERSETSEHLYYKTDMHADEVGQLPVVKAIIAAIARAENRPDIHWHEHFVLGHAGNWNGSEARFLSLLFPPTEEVPGFKGRYAVGGRESDGHWVVTDPLVLQRADQGVGRPYDFEFSSRPDLCPERLPGIALFGNSFSDLYWVLGMHRYFCFIRRARNPISRFRAFYDTIPDGTKYFIFEYYAPWVTEVLDDPWFSDGGDLQK